MKKIRFSIIIPVYNTERYLKKCIQSVINQNYDNLEIIIINDGSKGKCKEIVKNFKKIKYIEQKNQGLSVARNKGVKIANGEYIIFLDSDDYMEPNLLSILDQQIKNEDLIRFQLRTYDESENKQDYFEIGFDLLNGKEAFEKISKYHFVESACLYAINKNYWENGSFAFIKNKYHEDFGLIPTLIYKASTVKSLNYIGNNYLQREDSIMNTQDEVKNTKKSFDVLEQGLHEINEINKFDCNSKYKQTFNSFIVNSIFIKAKDLDGKKLLEYTDVVRKNNLLDYLLSDTIRRKLKKMYYKIKYNL